MTDGADSTYVLPARLSIPGFNQIERISSGGYGDVYRARKDGSDDDVALKVLKERFLSDAEPRRRLKLEFDTLARIQADHLCRVRDYQELESTSGILIPYIVMDYYPGGTAADLLSKSAVGLPDERVLSIAFQLGLAMTSLHPAVVHRDIKPSNLLFDRQGNLKLSDFGLVKVVSSLTADGITRTGAVVGTPGWVPCEVLQNPGQVVAPSWDVFSSAVTLWELASGSHPFRRGDHIISMGPCDPDFDYSGTVRHPVLRSFLIRCLARDPSNRITDGCEFLDRLDEVRRVRAVFEHSERRVNGGWIHCSSQCSEFELRFNSSAGEMDVLARSNNHEGFEFLLTDADSMWNRGRYLNGRITSGSCTIGVDDLPDGTLVLMSPPKGDSE